MTQAADRSEFELLRSRVSYYRALELSREDKPASLALLDNTAARLEDALLSADPSSRQGILTLLHDCYSPLCVESFLPDNMRRADLRYGWDNYIQRQVDVAKELKGYQEQKEAA